MEMNQTIGREIWMKVLAEMSQEVSRPRFETWFKTTQFVSYQIEILTIAAQNRFSRDWLVSQYGDMINKTMQKLYPLTKLKITAKEHKKRVDC